MTAESDSLRLAPLLPAIAAQARAADETRSVSPAVISALKASDVMRMSAAPEIGGLGSSLVEIGLELEAAAAACASTAWCLWNHLAVFHIFCGLLGPAPFPTEGMSARLNPNEGEGRSYSDMSRNPMGRVGKMPEMANLAVYLLAPGSEYVNGQTIAIDGGAFLATGGNFSGLSVWGDEEWRKARDAIASTNARDRAARTV